jgi:hypothetical protein
VVAQQLHQRVAPVLACCRTVDDNQFNVSHSVSYRVQLVTPMLVARAVTILTMM